MASLRSVRAGSVGARKQKMGSRHLSVLSGSLVNGWRSTRRVDEEEFPIRG